MRVDRDGLRVDRDRAEPRTRARGRPPTVEPRIERIQEIMTRLGWSPAELARRAGLDVSVVYRLLREEKQLGLNSLMGLLAAFGDVFPDADLDDLFDELLEVYDDAGSGQPPPVRRPSGATRPPDAGPPSPPPGDTGQAREEADVPALTP